MKKKIAVVAIAISVFAVSAWAEESVQGWIKTKKKGPDYVTAMEECQYETVKYCKGDAHTAVGFAAAISDPQELQREMALFNQCMKLKGWIRTSE
ncbi:MAG: hypothetical protein ABSG35_03555 [Syntrophobacteraceae bacterium]